MSSSNFAFSQGNSATQNQTEIQNLYSDHHRWLHSWLQQKMGSRFDAEDLTQDTFTRILVRNNTETINEPRAYLVTVARGLLVNHFRRKDVEKAYLDALITQDEAQALSPEQQHLIFETLYQINLLLDGLPAKVKKAFLLSQLDGLTYQQIALKLNVSVSSIKKYMHKATLHCLKFKLKHMS